MTCRHGYIGECPDGCDSLPPHDPADPIDRFEAATLKALVLLGGSGTEERICDVFVAIGAEVVAKLPQDHDVALSAADLIYIIGVLWITRDRRWFDGPCAEIEAAVARAKGGAA